MMTRREQYALAVRTAAVSGALAVAVAGVMLADYSTRTAKDPLNSPTYLALKQQLQTDPQNESLQLSLRGLDRELREGYFNRREFAQWGAWLLLASAALCLGSAKWAATLRRQLPNPQPVEAREDSEERDRRTSRWSVAALAGAAAILAVSLYTGFRSSLPADVRQLAELMPGETAGTLPGMAAAGVDTTTVGEPASATPMPVSPGMPVPADSPPAAAAAPTGTPVVAVAGDLPELPAGYPSDEEIRKNWPEFRGPGGLGIATYDNVPTTWNVESGEGIRWKTAIPLPGNNSPIVWNERVFVTGADDQTNEVYCLDAGSGELLWQRPLPKTPESPAEVPNVMEATGLAASTAATDGRRVVAIFANGEIGAFDFEGRLRWQRSLGLPKNSYGHASSLTIYRDLVLVQFDQGTRKDGLSKLIALQADTGATVWEAPREVPNSWPSPIVIQVGDQPQIITCADPWVIAYAPADGAEIWRAKCLQGDVGPSAAFAAGLVFAANEFAGVAAIRADGTGDVTDSHVVWEADLGVPDCCSPLATDEIVLLVASYGILTCYDAQEGGDPLWEHEFDNASFVSSPTLVGQHVFLFDEAGTAWIVAPTRDECRVVTENALGEECVTTPAFQDGRMFVRGKEHLFCIGNP